MPRHRGNEMRPGLIESLCSVNKAQEGYLVHRFCEMVALICADPLITDRQTMLFDRLFVTSISRP